MQTSTWKTGPNFQPNPPKLGGSRPTGASSSAWRTLFIIAQAFIGLLLVPVLFFAPADLFIALTTLSVALSGVHLALRR